MPRRFWLSFVDDNRPKGEKFVGVCIVEVTDEEAAEAKIEVDAMFPNHAEDAEWVAAASRKAWATGCNPGGQVAVLDLADDPVTDYSAVPLYRLLQRADLERLGLI